MLPGKRNPHQGFQPPFLSAALQPPKQVPAPHSERCGFVDLALLRACEPCNPLTSVERALWSLPGAPHQGQSYLVPLSLSPLEPSPPSLKTSLRSNPGHLCCAGTQGAALSRDAEGRPRALGTPELHLWSPPPPEATTEAEHRLADCVPSRLDPSPAGSLGSST